MVAATKNRRTTKTTKSAEAEDFVDLSALDAYDIHEVAKLFPMIDTKSLKALADDIAQHGQQEPIWMYKGKLLDGRNRVVACAMAGRDPIVQQWKPKAGESPFAFVMSRNLHRRHMSASQRAALAVDLEEFLAGEGALAAEAAESGKATSTPFSHTNKPTVALSATGGTSVEFTSGDPTGPARVGEKVHTGRLRDKAASTMKVSAGYFTDAKGVKRADPDRFEKIKTGELTLANAQTEIVAEAEASGTLDEVKLRPGAVKTALERLAQDSTIIKRPEPKPKIRLPKASKVTTSATTLQITATFGNRAVAEEWLNRMQDDKKVMDLDYEVVAKRPRKKA